MKVQEALKERRTPDPKAEDVTVKADGESSEETVEKCMGYVPYNVYSFSQLEVAEKVHGIQEQYSKAFYAYMQIADNIMWDKPNEYPDLLLNLTREFSIKLTQIKMESGQMFKSGSVALFKANDQLQWVGVPTNKFQDKQKDIISDSAHRKFVAKLKSGEAPMPDLYPWHTGAIGKATWVDYDERGFLVAGGYILKEYEEFAINLITNTTEPMGMSHGMYEKDIVWDTDNTIAEYKSFEFSFLPLSKAANLLTSFTEL